MSTLNYASIFNAFLSDNNLWPAILAWLDTAHIDFNWLESRLRDSPALVIGMTATVLFPLLAATGSLLRLALPGSTGKPPGRISSAARMPNASAANQRAILEFQRHDATPFEIGHAIVRIGRESDNDVTLTHPSVHRYHAVIERTLEGDVHIAYIGAPDGNVLRVNGYKTNRHHLTGGEILDIGAIKLRFTLTGA